MRVGLQPDDRHKVTDMTVPDYLLAVWSDIPDVACKGLCTESCGPIAGSLIEEALLQRRGIQLRPIAEAVAAHACGGDVVCPALVAGRCSVYEVRPTVCRLWGAVEDMPCPFGCEPVGGRLSHDEGIALLCRSLGGR